MKKIKVEKNKEQKMQKNHFKVYLLENMCDISL